MGRFVHRAETGGALGVVKQTSTECTENPRVVVSAQDGPITLTVWDEDNEFGHGEPIHFVRVAVPSEKGADFLGQLIRQAALQLHKMPEVRDAVARGLLEDLNVLVPLETGGGG